MATTKLTKAKVEAATPNTFLWDSQTPGLGLRVLPSGKRSFVLQYRSQGERRTRRVTLGRFPAVTVEHARRKALKLLAEIADGADPSQERRDAARGATVADLLDRFVAEHASRKKSRTAAEYRRQCDRYLKPALGARKVAHITTTDVERFHRSMAGRPVCANRCLSLLAVAFTLAERWGLRNPGTNPCRAIERFRERPRERFLSPVELARLAEAMRELETLGVVSAPAAAAVRLLMLTGLRKNEAVQLRWEDVDLDAGVIRLRDAKTGGRRARLAAPACQLLAELPRPSQWCFPRPDGQAPVSLDHSWRKIRERADLAPDAEGRPLRVHDLRHTFASIGAGSGMSLLLIGKTLGHSQAKTTQRYAHLSDDPVRDAVETIGGRIAAAMEGREPAPVVPLHRERG